MAKVIIKIVQGIQCSYTNHVRWANYISPGCKFPFLQCICAKNYENWLAVDKVIANISRLTFWPTLYVLRQTDKSILNDHASALQLLLLSFSCRVNFTSVLLISAFQRKNSDFCIPQVTTPIILTQSLVPDVLLNALRLVCSSLKNACMTIVLRARNITQQSARTAVSIHDFQRCVQAYIVYNI